jgi:hypothetical protein
LPKINGMGAGLAMAGSCDAAQITGIAMGNAPAISSRGKANGMIAECRMRDGFRWRRLNKAATVQEARNCVLRGKHEFPQS